MSIINPFVHEFYIDLQNGTTQQREKKPLSQGDAYADKIVVHVQDGGNEVSLAGVGVSAKVIRYDGQTVPIVGHVEDGAACVVLDAACYAKPGDVRVSVALSVGEMVQTVLVLSMSVETSETSIIADNGVVSDLTEILTALADMRSATDRANSAAKRAEDAAERAENAGGGGGGGGTGQDGFSPIAFVQETPEGAVITITDKAGTTTATVRRGEAGPKGDPGVKVGKEEPTDPDVMVWVDPSGDPDGDFEVVKTVNVTQDGVAEIVEDGLALRKALITVYLPAGDAALNLNANVYMTDGTTGLYANISNAQNTAERYTKLRADVANGALELKVQAPTVKATNAAGMNAYGCIMAAGYVNKVRLYMGSSKPFPVGAWVKIEGVSAVA